jgi:hypothetical protein
MVWHHRLQSTDVTPRCAQCELDLPAGEGFRVTSYLVYCSEDHAIAHAPDVLRFAEVLAS